MSLMNTGFDNVQPQVEEVQALVEQVRRRAEHLQRREHANSVSYVPQQMRTNEALGKGAIEFDPRADCSEEAIERGVSAAAFIALLIVAIYLVYLTVSQIFEPMIYAVTHF